MQTNQKSSARRQLIRENRPDTSAAWFNELRCAGLFPSLGIAAIFWILTTSILMLRPDVLPYRPNQSVQHDITSRVDFAFVDNDLRAQHQAEARNNCPHIFRSTASKATADVWQNVQDQLLALPDRVSGLTHDQLPEDLKKSVDTTALTALQLSTNKTLRAEYNQKVIAYIAAIRQKNWVILPAHEKRDELDAKRSVIILTPGDSRFDLTSAYTIPADDDLTARIRAVVWQVWRTALQQTVESITVSALAPTYQLDKDQSALAAATAADRIPESDWTIQYRALQPIVDKGIIDARGWKVLVAENRAYLATLNGAWKSSVGIALTTLLLTIATAMYTAAFQPRVVKNHMRALAIVALMSSMLLLSELAGAGSGPIYLFAVTPTLLVGMILTIAYDQRFAVGLASIHAILVTVGLDQRIGFLVIIWVGVVFACFMLTDIRSRSRLIEVGGVSAIAMMLATAAWGLITLDNSQDIISNSLFAGAAGLATGFIVLGILPFIEKAFRITTGMTLLELSDFSHPLLRRLALEAPGTYSHSLQVATLAEAAAEAIGANSLLCRVAAYYHDVGKINKPDYFVENQQQGQENRHIHLSPHVSFLIIKGHVMDGVEMAREYMLPTSIFPFVLQHHGTTLVEFFYHNAKEALKKQGDDTEISDTEFRYPGPKPRNKEVAILMLADCVESATRAMSEPTAGAIEGLVHKLAMNRLLDGQFDDCELTFRDLAKIEKSLTKTLLSIYHGRIAYPSTASITTAPAATAAVKIS
jgi:putative nucleotidyltransferase with HDIG domain